MLTADSSSTVNASQPDHHSGYGTGSEAQRIQRDHPEWENFDPTRHPEWKKLLGMLEQTNLTMSDLKLITDLAAADEGISPPGRPYIRRKAGMAEWIAKHWKSVRKVVSDGQVHLQETKGRNRGADMRLWSRPTTGIICFISDQLDEEDDEFIQ
jgi:hypothetical protein